MISEQTDRGIVGQGLDRVDGRLKVTGGARYAAEFGDSKAAHAVLLQSTIAKGRIVAIDASAALAAPGALAVITYENATSVKEPPLVPEISYSGQHVAIVVAESFEQAQGAADLVRVTYESSPPEIQFEKSLDKAFASQRSGRASKYSRGDAATTLSSAPTKLDEVYRTPIMHHNPMEPHATVAIWNGEKLTAYDATQGVVGSAQKLAQQFGIPAADVQLIDPFVGGGFGCKGMPWPHSTCAAMAAKVVGRPVKLALDRRQMFTSNGHRPPTHVSTAISTDATGRLTAWTHDHINHTSIHDDFLEPTGALTEMLYSCPNVTVNQKLVRVNVGSPTYMRAPGESSGSFGIESAMDEVAASLGMDPIEFRLKNYADHDESTDRPWSSKSLKECYARGAEAFGWQRRSAAPGSMKHGNLLVGYGMATASYPANFRQSTAIARVYADGSVHILCATQDLGTGTYTILTQLASDELGVPPSRIRVEIGDSLLPPSPGSGGSTSASSAGSSVLLACRALRKSMMQLAASDESGPLHNVSLERLRTVEGAVVHADEPARAINYSDILKKAGKPMMEEEATAKPGAERGGPGSKGYSMHSFGAQFCEVHIDPELFTVRLARWVGAFAVGRPLNAKTLESQLRGGIVFGIGMALMEESVLDPTYGRIVNSNLAEYHVPVNADVPPIEVIVIPELDPYVNPAGTKGAGEIGITGAAAAIANAVYHATGKRIRDLPITLDKLMV